MPTGVVKPQQHSTAAAAVKCELIQILDPNLQPAQHNRRKKKQEMQQNKTKLSQQRALSLSLS